MIVLCTPKREIQEKTKALAHAAAYVSNKEMASIHLDVRSMTVKMKLKNCHYTVRVPPNQCADEKNIVEGWGLAAATGRRVGESWPAATVFKPGRYNICTLYSTMKAKWRWQGEIGTETQVVCDQSKVGKIILRRNRHWGKGVGVVPQWQGGASHFGNLLCLVSPLQHFWPPLQGIG